MCTLRRSAGLEGGKSSQVHIMSECVFNEPSTNGMESQMGQQKRIERQEVLSFEILCNFSIVDCRKR
jgi:hypothetical protein